MKKEVPILFSDSMIKAILSGEKTVTCRILNPQPPSHCRLSPKYKTGQTLWVRETWGISAYSNESAYEIVVWYKADKKESGWIDLDDEELWERLVNREEKFQKDLKLKKYFTRKMYCIKCSSSNCINCSHNINPDSILWRPSIFIPRAASRLILEIIDVQLQRINEITDADAKNEGFENRERFIVYWNKLNKKRGSFESNPWVYRVQFKVKK
jgi:hypothetical protein